jgi:hypothetical protein
VEGVAVVRAVQDVLAFPPAAHLARQRQHLAGPGSILLFAVGNLQLAAMPLHILHASAGTCQPPQHFAAQPYA